MADGIENKSDESPCSDEKTQAIGKYRAKLNSVQQKMQSEYDKTVIALSGAAFSASWFFLRDISPNKQIHITCLIEFAWFFWAVSILAVLASYYSSSMALERAIQQVDQGKITGTGMGGILNTFTKAFNIISGSAFFAGVILFIFHVAVL